MVELLLLPSSPFSGRKAEAQRDLVVCQRNQACMEGNQDLITNHLAAEVETHHCIATSDHSTPHKRRGNAKDTQNT